MELHKYTVCKAASNLPHNGVYTCGPVRMLRTPKHEMNNDRTQRIHLLGDGMAVVVDNVMVLAIQCGGGQCDGGGNTV